MPIFIFFGAVSLAIFVVLVVVQYTAMILPFVIIGVGTYALIRKWQVSPERQEELSRRHTYFLYEQAKESFGDAPSQEAFFTRLYETFPKSIPEEVQLGLIAIAKEMYANERFGELPEPPAICNSEEGAAYRDFLSEQGAKNNQAASDLAADIMGNFLTDFVGLLPEFPETGTHITIPLFQFIDNEKELVDLCVSTFLLSGAGDRFGLYKSIKRQIDKNAKEVALKRLSNGGVKDYKGDDVVGDYIDHTPLLDLFLLPVSFGIPFMQRFEAMWVVGRQGSGKTQLLQSILVEDLRLVAANQASVVVIDGHGDLIKNIRNLKMFAKGQELEGKLVIIEPDLDHPPALNLFDIGRGRLNQYSDTDREMIMGVAEKQFEYVIEAMLGEGGSLTALQAVPFGYITRLLFQVPDANLSTFSQILGITSHDKRREGLKRFQKYIDMLSEAEQDFFRDQFYNQNFDQTKQQIGLRIAALRKNQFFESMFGAKQTKLDMFEELNSSKVFVVNTDRRVLGEYGTNVFGRYFIASILTAAEERAILAPDKRQPAFVYVDEAHDYMAHDTKVATIIDQCRKMRIGLIASHQRINQMDGPVKDALGNSAIKFANTNNQSCLKTLSHALHTDSDFISFQPNLQFAVHFSGLRRAFNYPVTPGLMEALPTMTQTEKDAVQQGIWEKYTTGDIPDVIYADYVEGEYEPPKETGTDLTIDDDEPGIFPKS